VTTKGDEGELLRSVALQNAKSILVARQRAERRREAYLAEAQRLSRTGSFGWTVSTGEINWSEETFRIFQYDRTAIPTVELVLQRVHPEDAALVKQTIERASQDGRDFDHEYRLVMPDRSVKHVHVVAHASRDESGGIEFVGAVMDVTAAKQTERRIRQIIDTIPAHAWSSVPDGSVDFVNQRFVDFTGRSIEELLGWEWGSSIHPDDLSSHVGLWRAALAAGEPMESEVRVRGRDGDYRWLLMRNVPLRDELGNIVKWYGTAIEIEDRKRAEMLLAGEKRLLEMIARGDSRAFILDALCRLVEELASGSLSSILLLDSTGKRLRHGAAPNLPIPYTQAIDGGAIGPAAGSCGTAAYRAEAVIVSDIATDPLWADYRDLALAHGLRACWSTPILSSEGRVLGTFAMYYREPRSPAPREQDVIEQITHLASIAIEREQAEERLRQAQADLARVSRVTTMGELTASVAHEVNQPIAAAVTNANACLRWLAGDIANLEEARAAATRIVRDGTRAAEIISRIRLLFKKGTPQRELADVNEVIRETIALLRSEATRYSISVHTEPAANLPQIMGDRVQLQQVLMNLIMNSIEAMKEVDGTRELVIKSQRGENEEVLVSVSDTGVGLPPHQADQIFNAFFSTKPHGTGMGLSISRSIVESHGGRLWAAGNSPRGARFCLTLPIKVEARE
jgi:PAS domain S-box-containing protein